MRTRNVSQQNRRVGVSHQERLVMEGQPKKGSAMEGRREAYEDKNKESTCQWEDPPKKCVTPRGDVEVGK